METIVRSWPRATVTTLKGAAPDRSARPGHPFVLADGHVHFYPCYDRDRFFDAALQNFRAGARELGLPEGTPGCLLLSEGRAARWFERLVEEAGGRPRGAWAFDLSPDPEVLVARRRREPGARLFLVAGRQIVAREGVEVLALVTADRFGDGLPLADTLGWVGERGAIAVLPWGFGKWSLARGELVRRALAHRGRHPLFLGDSALRPRLAPRPQLFGVAAETRIHILPGTDPLPFPHHADRAGSYGFALAGPWDEAEPARGLRRLLAGQPRQPRAYGRREGLLGFARAQVAMQARKSAPGRGW